MLIYYLITEYILMFYWDFCVFINDSEILIYKNEVYGN